MYIVGITGPMGSGKSFISHRFEKLGDCVIFNSDNVVKDIHKNEMYDLLIKRYGSKYFKENGDINTEYIKPFYFADSELAKQNLEWHKNTIHDFFEARLMNVANNTEKKYVLFESAILFEYDLIKYCDEIIYVKNESALENAIRRDNISINEYNQRMSTQISFDEKSLYLDYVINNITFDESVFDYVGWINESIVRKSQKIKKI